MKNRYQNLLEKYNQEIINLNPGNFTSRLILALELKKTENTHSRVLEIGCGQGHSALPVLENTTLNLDLLDVSENMINKCKMRLSCYEERVHYIQKDCLQYLTECESYDVIFSEFVIHNFTWAEKIELFNAMATKIVKGGFLILMDKILPNGDKDLFEFQMKRYTYVNSEVREILFEHEIQDNSPEFRMDEGRTINELVLSGFNSITIVDRLERNVVLIAKK